MVNLNYHVKFHQDLEIPIEHTYNHTINKLIFLYKACRIAKYGTFSYTFRTVNNRPSVSVCKSAQYWVVFGCVTVVFVKTM